VAWWRSSTASGRTRQRAGFGLPPDLADEITQAVKAADRGAAYLEATHLAGFSVAEAKRLLRADETSFCGELEAAFAHTLGALRLGSKRAAFPLRRQLAQAYIAGRVALIGDAAHVVHPLAGQGVNLGLRDVAALRVMLQRAVTRNADIGASSQLSRWARQRRSENAVAAHAYDGFNRLFSNDQLAATLLRGPLLGLAGRLPPLTHALWRHAAGL